MNNFLVIKHFADPIRREGKNIGVVVFTDEEPVIRFVGQQLNDGLLGNRSKPQGIRAPYFRAMIDYWQGLLDARQDLDYWLGRNRQDATIVYEYGGETLGEMPMTSGELAEELFERFVDVPQIAKPFSRRVRSWVRSSGALDLPNFLGRDVEVASTQTEERFRFDYGWGTEEGRPAALLYPLGKLQPLGMEALIRRSKSIDSSVKIGVAIDPIVEEQDNRTAELLEKTTHVFEIESTDSKDLVEFIAA